MEMVRAFHRCFREGTYGIQISKKVSSDCRNRRPDADSASERASCRARITSRTRRHGVGEVYTDRPQCILQLLGKGLRTAGTREEIRWRFCSRRFGPCARRQTEPAGRAVLAHRKDTPRKLTDALPNGTWWGELQTGVDDGAYGGGPLGTLWISALANPRPQQAIKSIRLQAVGEDPLLVCGLTLFHGRENPLRYERLSLYRLTLPEATAEEKDRW